MGILNRQKKKAVEELSASDMRFLLAKMRIATYTGEEFEQFYQVWVKLNNALEQIDKEREP